MAKRPTIRLKKTELPIDGASAVIHADNELSELCATTTALLASLHTIEGQRAPETTARLIAETEVQSVIFRNRTLKLAPDFRNVASRRILDCQSHLAPWVWKAKNTVRATALSASTPLKSERESFADHGPYTDLSLYLEFDTQHFDHDVVAKAESDAIHTAFLNRTIMRALNRYIDRVNWECVKNAIPATFTVNPKLTDAWPTPRIFKPRIRIFVTFERLWLSSEKYTARTLKGLAATQRAIPAEYDLETAKVLMKMPRDEAIGDGRLLVNPISTEDVFNVIGTHITKVPQEWIEEMLFGSDPSPEDVRSGKAPIPPKAELILLTSLMEKIPEMKRIVKTLMRVAKPYDPISFLPTGL